MHSIGKYSKLEKIKIHLEILALFLGLILFPFALIEFNEFLSQREAAIFQQKIESKKRLIENRLKILENFSPTLSYKNIFYSSSSEGYPKVEIVLQNESLNPVDFSNVGVNYFDCSGQPIANTHAPDGYKSNEQRFHFWPKSILSVSSKTNPIQNNLPEIYLGKSARPFVVEFNFAASMNNIKDFRPYIEASDMVTPARDGPGGLDNFAPLSWVYSIRAAYIHETAPYIVVENDFWTEILNWIGQIYEKIPAEPRISTELEEPVVFQDVLFLPYLGTDCLLPQGREMNIITNSPKKNDPKVDVLSVTIIDGN